MVLRVLVVVSSDARRGAEVEGTQLAEQLTAIGHVARSVALSPAATGGLDVECLGPSRLSRSTLRRLRRLAREHDVVVAYGSSTLPACAIGLLGTRVPFVYRSIGDPAAWVRGRAHRWRTGLLFRRAAAVVALWDDAAASIRGLYRVKAQRLSVIPNARPPASGLGGRRADARRVLGVPNDAELVTVVGALSPEKRPLLAVEAVAGTPDAFLLIVGAGRLSDQVAESCDRLLAGRHRMLGVVSPLDDVWAATDVVLLTSCTEGMPGVLIEAQLAGVPAVASDVGAVRLVVADGVSGRLVGASEPSEFAAALQQVLQDRDAMSVAATTHAQQFSWTRVAPLWVDVLGRCTSRASGSPIARA